MFALYVGWFQYEAEGGQTSDKTVATIRPARKSPAGRCTVNLVYMSTSTILSTK